MQKRLKKLGVTIILLGFVLIINSSLIKITGNVISESFNMGDSIFGLVLIIGGLALFLSQEGKSGLEIKVYDISKGKRKEENFYEMTDPNLYFGNMGKVNLSEFKRGIKDLKGDPELIQLVKEEYGEKLLELNKKGNVLEKEISKRFLNVLYGNKIPSEEKEILSKEEKKDIRRAFDSGWYGRPNRAQSKVLKNFGLAYKSGSGHGKIYSIDNPKNNMGISSTPSDTNAGKNIARDLFRLIKKF